MEDYYVSTASASHLMDHVEQEGGPPVYKALKARANRTIAKHRQELWLGVHLKIKLKKREEVAVKRVARELHDSGYVALFCRPPYRRTNYLEIWISTKVLEKAQKKKKNKKRCKHNNNNDDNSIFKP